MAAWFEKGSGTFAGTARRELRTKVPDPFSNHAAMADSRQSKADMADVPPNLPRFPTAASVDALPPVRFEVRHGAARPTLHLLTDVGFLIGSVPGCDLRLGGA